MIPLELEQGTPEWLTSRLGVITASRAHDLLPNARTKSFAYKEARQTYMNQLIGEVCTGWFEEINARALEWGKANENAAICSYEFASGNTVKKLGFAYKDETKRAGASPDFLVVGQKKGGENKCPITPAPHIDFILNGIVKPEYITQCQFSMWVCGFDEWDFTSYHPMMKTKLTHFVTIKRDSELMKYFDEEVPRFVSEMDEKLKQIGISWGQQWL